MSIVIHSESKGSDTGNLSEVCPYPFVLFRAGKAKGLCESYRRDGTFHNLYTPPGSIVPDDLTRNDKYTYFVIRQHNDNAIFIR